MSYSPTWNDWAEILFDENAPLSNRSGYIKGRFPGRTFHPWDCNLESFVERLDAGPGEGPTALDEHFELCREFGRKMGREIDRRVFAAVFGDK